MYAWHDTCSTFLVNWKGTQPSVWCLNRKEKGVINKVFSNNNLTLEICPSIEHSTCHHHPQKKIVSNNIQSVLYHAWQQNPKIWLESLDKVVTPLSIGGKFFLFHALTSLIIVIVGGWMGNGGPPQGFSMICPIIVYKLHPILTSQNFSIQCC